MTAGAGGPVDWCESVLGPEGPWTLLAIHTKTDGSRTVKVANTPAEVIAEARQLAADCDVYVGMGRLSRVPQKVRGHYVERGQAEDVQSIHSLWVDVDILGPGHTKTNLPASVSAARELLAALPLPPSWLVATGGGVHAYWALEEPLEATEAVGLLERWGYTWKRWAEQAGYHLDSVFDIARVLRIPGTYNHKGGGTVLTEILDSAGHVYSPDDLGEYLLTREEIPAAQTWVAPDLDRNRPGDDFKAQHACGEILQQLGWTLHHVDRASGDQHWTRPGKERREGASATVYQADGRCVIWTESVPGVNPRESLDAFRLLAKLQFGGDFGAAATHLAKMGYGSMPVPDLSWIDDVQPAAPKTAPGAPPVADDELRAMLIDWGQFWAKEHEGEQWLVQPLIPAFRSVSIHAPGGTGKSLVALYIAAALATGRGCLGSAAQPPMNVLYADYEMTEEDVYERLESMGYGPETDLSHLHYALLPTIGPLDTREGGQKFARLAALVGADLCVVDTFARVLEGEEDKADTIRNFYLHTGSVLKQARRALLRLDHTGKNKEGGARGSSAKRDDVDVAWSLGLTETGFQLKAEKRRMSWVPLTVDINKDEEEDLRFLLRPGTEPGWPAGTATIAARLDVLGVSPSASRRAAAEALKAADGAGVRASLVLAAQKYRKMRTRTNYTETLPDVPEMHGESRDDMSRHQQPWNDGSGTTDPGTTDPRPPGTIGNHTPRRTVPWPVRAYGRGSGNHREPREPRGWT